jgi:hypothetical protein
VISGPIKGRVSDLFSNQDEMPRTVSESEPLESVLERTPSENLITPEANCKVPIRPLKRVRTEDDADEEDQQSGTDTESPQVSPAVEPKAKRMLDFDKEKEETPVEEEEDRQEATQPWPPVESEEGEIPSDTPV